MGNENTGAQGILTDIRAAVKRMTVDTFGDSVLLPERRDAFIRAIQRRSVVLDEARFQRMDSNIVDIDTVWLNTILTRGKPGTKEDNDWLGTETKQKVGRSTHQLRASEMRGALGLEDRAKRRNIEKDQIENTILDLAGGAVGRDLEHLALLGEVDRRGNEEDEHPLIGLFNGWLEKAAKKVENPDKDHADWPVNLFEAMLTEIDDKYLVNPAEYRFYVPWTVKNDYANYLIKRTTALGDSAIIGDAASRYKEFPIRIAPLLANSKVYNPACLLAPPDNMVWGIFHEVTIEEDRVPADRSTDWYVTIEADAGYEAPAAACAGYVDISES